MNQQKKYPLDNPAKSSPTDRKKSPERILKEKEEKKEKRTYKVGKIVTILEGVFILAFLGMLFTVDLLPFKYVAIIFLLVSVLFFVTCKTQGRKGLHIVGKIVGITTTIFLIIGIYGLIIVNMTLDAIACEQGDGTKESAEVVGTIFNIYTFDGNNSKVLTINRDTHQILEVSTPDKYYAVIPEVSNGQKDTLEKARTYGVEVTRTMLGSIYEMKIPYDLQWNKQGMTEFQGSITFKMLFQPEVLVEQIDTNVETNLTKKQLRQLIKQYLNEDNVWEIYPVKLTGVELERKTYTSPKEPVLVLEPDKEKLDKIIELVNRMEDGERLDAYDINIK